jgi:DNA topoisomerase-1
MENALDKIANNELIWYELCKNCNDQIDLLINRLKYETKTEIKLDKNNTYIIGKYGPVIKSIKEMNNKEEIIFKPIKKDFDIKLIETNNFEIKEIIDINKLEMKEIKETNKLTKPYHILGQYNGQDVILKKGKYGLYIIWGKNSKTLKEFGNRPIENIKFDEVKKYLDEESNLIRNINSNISIRKGSKGDYIFMKTLKMKKPQFYDIKCFELETNEDYKICNISILKSWIFKKYNLII